MSLAASLRSAGFAGDLATERPLAEFTTWKIGGPAELLAQPQDREDVVRAVRWAATRGVPWRILGNGSNLLVRDEGVRGMVIRIRKILDDVSFEAETVTAGAGALLPAVANRAASRGLGGIEFGAGIPGTVGGAMVMNAGWHEFEVKNVVRSVEFLEQDGATRRYPREACAFGYRTSVFRSRPGAILAAELVLDPGDPQEIRRRLEHYASSRKSNQPTELPSCGSVFLKPPGDFAGRLIDAAGLKEMRVGDIQVSPKHANFFLNLGNGTTAQVLELVERVEREVEERFGVRLSREFEIW